MSALPINTGLSELVGSIPPGQSAKVLAFLASRYPGPASRRELMRAGGFYEHQQGRTLAHASFEWHLLRLLDWLRPQGWDVSEPPPARWPVDDSVPNYRLVPTKRR